MVISAATVLSVTPKSRSGLVSPGGLYPVAAEAVAPFGSVLNFKVLAPSKSRKKPNLSLTISPDRMSWARRILKYVRVSTDSGVMASFVPSLVPFSTTNHPCISAPTLRQPVFPMASLLAIISGGFSGTGGGTGAGSIGGGGAGAMATGGGGRAAASAPAPVVSAVAGAVAVAGAAAGSAAGATEGSSVALPSAGALAAVA